MSIAIATCNHGPTLRAVLDAIDATDWPGLELIVADCGSTDGGLQLLRERAARQDGVPLRLLELPGAGRATALNAAFAAAGRREVVRLHGDVVPDEPDWLRRLHAVLEAHPDCGIVGGKIVLAGGRIQSCGRNLINGLGIVAEWSDLRWLEADRAESPRSDEVDAVSGELCWIRRAVLDATGGLDTNYDPVFWDDDDHCLLARWHGFSVRVERAVRGVHYAPRRSTTTGPDHKEPSGGLDGMLDARATLHEGHRDYFRRKWGFDSSAPDLHEVRRRYGHTRICWRIGERLTERLPARPAVDVCFVTWNSMAILPRAMAHLAATRWQELDIWICDNGSTDGTVDYLERLAETFPFPIHVLRLPQNMGVAQGLNVAFAAGTAPIVARIDDDTIVSPEWIERLVPRFHQRPYAGMVGPKILNDGGGDMLQAGPSRQWPDGFRGCGPDEACRVDCLARVVTIRGCCNLYRRSVFAEIGLLDIGFSPSQFDEWDHQIALAVAGYETIYDGSVTVRHQLTAGRVATPASIGNRHGNLGKSHAKWGHRHFHALDRAIDLSIEGRFLPADGDTTALRAALPAVPDGPPVPVARDPEQLSLLQLIARRRIHLRGLGGPLAPWWRSLLAAGEQQMADGDPAVLKIMSKAMDLLPQDPHALMFVARYRARDGDPTSARMTARHALRLSPDDVALQQAGQDLLGAQATVEIASPPPRKVRVLLVPPMDLCHEIAHEAVAAASRALDAVGTSHRIERQLAPDPRGVEAVHFFGIDDPSTLACRVQVARAVAPNARIVLSTLAPDPAAGNWISAVMGEYLLARREDLLRLFQVAASGNLPVNGATGRRLPVAAFEHVLAYERHLLTFVDAIVCHSSGELEHWRGRHDRLPAAVILDEGVPLAVDAAAAQEFGEVAPGGVLAVGTRDLRGQHVQMLLALHGSGLPLTLIGRLAPPFAEWHTRSLADSRVSWLPPRTGDELAAAYRRSAVCLWLPSAIASFAVPLQAAIAGCELVIASGVGAEAKFGDHASYVDALDLAAVRDATLAAAARWRDDPDEPWRRELARMHVDAHYGERLLGLYGLGAGVVDRRLETATA
ncbi:MAG: glycosyltransferase [Planctomycetes bacterium]|nr:glycosyltransferase [Planctomycetota bacterium]